VPATSLHRAFRSNLVQTGRKSTGRGQRMARRGPSKAAEHIMDLVAMLPWWAGIALAAASYLLLSSLAARPIQVTAGPGQASGVATAAVIKGLATGGQVVVPMLCLAGAGLSAFRRHQRQRVMAMASNSAGSVDGMRWQEFEVLVGEAFRREGYHVTEARGGGPDGGVDLVLSRPAQGGTEKTLVQCKHWRAYKVGVDVVRELYGVMAARGAAEGIVVTSGRFTAEAQAFAQGRNVHLTDGPALRALIGEAQALGQDRTTRDISAMAPPDAEQASRCADRLGTAPACPACGKPMVERTAKRGARPGSRFWGCVGYPSCRGTRNLAKR